MQLRLTRKSAKKGQQTEGSNVRLFPALACMLVAVGSGFAASADEPPTINVTLKDHKFAPAEIHVAVGKPTVLLVRNQDSTPEEFDSTALKIEKVIVGGTYATIRLRPLGPGRYPFMGEFHPDTAQGVVIAE
jgi:hypothetical protein